MNGTDQGIECAITTISLPVYIYACFSATSKGSQQQFFSDGGGSSLISDSPSGALNDVRQYNAFAQNAQTIVSGTRYRMTALFRNGTGGNDVLKFGSNSPQSTGNSGPTTPPAKLTAGFGGLGIVPSQINIGLLMYISGVPSNVAALDAAVASYWSGGYAT